MTFCFWAGVAEIRLVLTFVRNNKFLYVQTAKVVNSKKILAAKGSNFDYGEEFSQIFQILIF